MTTAVFPLGVSKQRIGAVIVVLVLIALTGLVLRNSAATAEEQEASLEKTPVLPVNTIRVGQVRPPRIERSFAGVLIARRESQLGFDRSGRLEAITKEEGDTVVAGEVLAMLDIEELEAAEERTEAELASAEALLEELIAGPRKQTIEAANATVGQLTARLELANATARREQALADRGAGSIQALDEAQFAHQEISQQLRAARAELALLEEGTRKEQLVAQTAVCDAIRARLKEIAAQRRDSQIIAPFTGVIRSRMVDEGIVVTPAMPIIELISHEVEARCGLPPAVADSIGSGNVVTVSLRTYTCTGVVARLEPSVDLKTRTRAVYVTLEPSGADRKVFLAGETVDVHLELSDEDDADSLTKFWLPTTSLARGGRGLWAVLVLPGDDPIVACERRSIELLNTEGDYSLVQGMLQPGERVVVDGLHRIVAGMIVSDLPRESELP